MREFANEHCFVTEGFCYGPKNWSGGRLGRPPAGFIGISSRAAVTVRMKHGFKPEGAAVVVIQVVARATQSVCR